MRDLIVLTAIVFGAVTLFALLQLHGTRVVTSEVYFGSLVIVAITVVVLWKISKYSIKMIGRLWNKTSYKYDYNVYGKENRKPNPIRQKSVEKKEISAFCENCGKPLKPTAKFCGKCGTPRT